MIGGLGSAVAVVIAETDFSSPKRFKRIGIPDVFPREYGSHASQMESFSIKVINLVDTVTSFLLIQVIMYLYILSKE